MGDGNFIGGGSVDWEINNKDDDGGGGSKKYKGKDKKPERQTGGMFSVKVNGVRLIPDFPVEGNTVRVEWTPDIKE
jgi:hypothetical protein